MLIHYTDESEMKKTVENAFVFSTKGEVCPGCGMDKSACVCKPLAQNSATAAVLRIRRETKGRKGAGVTLIEGLGAPEIDNVAATLKKRCGTGGTVKDGNVELQGDMREAAERELSRLGYKTKRCGG